MHHRTLCGSSPVNQKRAPVRRPQKSTPIDTPKSTLPSTRPDCGHALAAAFASDEAPKVLQAFARYSEVGDLAGGFGRSIEPSARAALSKGVLFRG